MQNLQFSDHALKRMAQRGIKEDQILYVINNGAKHRSSERKAILYFGHKKCPDKLKGIHVLLSSDGTTVITCYKNNKLKWHDN
ncbi:MAG TPA: DUF4258 domain-containing protein [Mesotoga infera]|nr:DUF4258 domain-containing protein [Mesotoga infera]